MRQVLKTGLLNAVQKPCRQEESRLDQTHLPKSSESSSRNCRLHWLYNRSPSSMRTFALFIAVLVWSCPGLAQASQSREDTQSATTVIQAGHLLDIKSGRTIDNATV